MKQARWTRWSLVAVASVAGVVAVFPETAEAQRGRRGPRGSIVVSRGFYGGPYSYGYGWPYAHGFGWGYYGFGGGFGGPFGPHAEGGFTLGMAAAVGIGGVDLNVKPGAAEVWVDGKFRGEARDLDGDSNLLWLREGTHEIVIYKGGYQSFSETIAVEPGQRVDLKVRMEKGDSQPPGSRPGAKPKTTS